MTRKNMCIILFAAILAVSLAGCGRAGNAGTGAEKEKSYREDVSTAELKTAVAEALGEAYWPETEIPAEYLDMTYGVSAGLYEEYVGEMPMVSTNVDTLLIVKAKEDSVEEVAKALTAYREMLVGDTMQYPMNLGKIQASRVETFGRYVCFVLLGGDTLPVMDENPDNEDEAVIAYCQEQNQIALDAVKAALTSN